MTDERTPTIDECSRCGGDLPGSGACPARGDDGPCVNDRAAAAAAEVTWPTCPRCGIAYTVVLGLPVTIMAGGVRRFVDLEIDREIVLDEDATVSCGCGVDDEWDGDQYDEAAELLAPAIQSLIKADQVTATYDLRTGA